MRNFSIVIIASFCLFFGTVFGGYSLNPVADHSINGDNVVGYNSGWATVSDPGEYCYAVTYVYLDCPTGTDPSRYNPDSGTGSAASYGTQATRYNAPSGSYTVEAVSEIESTNYSDQALDYDYFTK